MENDKEEELELDFSKIKEKIGSIFKTKEKPAEKEEKEEGEIDLGEAIDKIRKNKKLFVWLALGLILALAFISRTANVKYLDHSLLSPDDPYIFFRYGNYIAEHGKIMPIDKQRHYPNGLNPERENLGTAYLAGYTLRFLRIFNPNIDMYDVAKYYAPTLFVIALLMFFLLTKELFKKDTTALIATGFLAFSPGILFRTTAGFLEKEPLFLPLFIASIYFFIKGYGEKDDKKRIILSAASGIFMGLAGFASGLFAYGMYIASLFVVFELILEKINKKKVISLWLFLILSAFTLSSLTLKYGNFLHIWFNLTFLISTGVAVISTAYLYMPNIKIGKEELPKGLITLGLVGVILIAATALISPNITKYLTYVITKVANPTATSRMGSSVSENQPPSLNNWISTFGIQLLFFYLGAVILFYKAFEKHKNAKWYSGIFASMLALMILENAGNTYGALTILKIISYVAFAVGTIYFIWKEKDFKEAETDKLFAVFWLAFSALAANSAMRLFFMLAVPAAVTSGYFIEFLARTLGKKEWKAILYGATFIFIFWTGINTTTAISHLNPGLQPWYEAFDWVKSNTEPNAVFVHWWDYGYLIQALGNRTTFVDPANFNASNNYDVGGHFFSAKNGSEVLSFLHRHGLNESVPTYFLTCSEDIPKFYQIARLGALAPGKEGNEAYFVLYVNKDNKVMPNNIPGYENYTYMLVLKPAGGPSQVLKDFKDGNVYHNGEKTFIVNYILLLNENQTGPLLARIYDMDYKVSKILPVNCLCFKEKGCYSLYNSGVPTCALLMKGGAVLNIPEKASDSLFTQLYVLNKTIPGFEKVYESKAPLDAWSILGYRENIEIWKINYTALENNTGAWQ